MTIIGEQDLKINLLETHLNKVECNKIYKKHNSTRSNAIYNNTTQQG